MVLLQYDYKGLRLHGKTRGLTHTDALYLEYIDGVRASPFAKRQSCTQRKLCKRQIDSASCLGGWWWWWWGSEVPRAIARGLPAF